MVGGLGLFAGCELWDSSGVFLCGCRVLRPGVGYAWWCMEERSGLVGFGGFRLCFGRDGSLE